MATCIFFLKGWLHVFDHFCCCFLSYLFGIITLCWFRGIEIGPNPPRVSLTAHGLFLGSTIHTLFFFFFFSFSFLFLFLRNESRGKIAVVVSG
jgi:hypothetical protein